MDKCDIPMDNFYLYAFVHPLNFIRYFLTFLRNSLHDISAKFVLLKRQKLRTFKNIYR